MARVKGGGYKGYELIVACVPTTTLKVHLDAWKLAGTDIVGKLVGLDFTANYAADDLADGETVAGEIVGWLPSGGVSDRSYVLSVRLHAYNTQNSTLAPATKIVNYAYSGTFALQDSVVANSSTCISVKDGDSGGIGACIAIDVPTSAYADILM